MELRAFQKLVKRICSQATNKGTVSRADKTSKGGLMKKQFLILFTLVSLAFPTASFGQKAVRVKFAKGATEAITTGSLKGYKSKAVVFMIRVKAGQTLSVEQLMSDNSTNYATFGITNPSGEDVTDAEANCNNRKTIENTAAGDYRIEVTECAKADAWSGSFKVKFTVK